MAHPVNQKYVHINDFEKPKKPYSWGIFNYSIQNEVFPVNFLSSGHSNFMWNFKKIL